MDGGRDRQTIRCLVATVGADEDAAEARHVARSFRDAGFEVVYAGHLRTPEETTQATVQEDVDVLTVVSPPTGRESFVRTVLDGLAEYGARQTSVVLVETGIGDDGGDLTDQDGVAVVAADTPTADLLGVVRERAPEQ